MTDDHPPHDLVAAYRFGVARHHRALATTGGYHRYGLARGTRFDYGNGMAAAAEAFASNLTGRAWVSRRFGKDDPDVGDLAGGVGVRWTHRAQGCLLVHQDERPHLKELLVVGTRLSTLRAVGYYVVGDVFTHPEWWRTSTGRPAYFVPQAVLRPVADLVLPGATQDRQAVRPVTIPDEVTT